MTATAGLLTNWDLVEVEDPDTFLAVDNCLFCVLEKGGEQKEFHPRQTVNFYSQYPRAAGGSLVPRLCCSGRLPARRGRHHDPCQLSLQHPVSVRLWLGGLINLPA